MLEVGLESQFFLLNNKPDQTIGLLSFSTMETLVAIL